MAMCVSRKISKCHKNCNCWQIAKQVIAYIPHITNLFIINFDCNLMKIAREVTFRNFCCNMIPC